MPLAFAGHFSPHSTLPSLNLYRRSFKPSKVLDKPYAMVGLNVIAAETDKEEQLIATTPQQQFLNLMRGKDVPLNHQLITFMKWQATMK
ncbi:hypothetical protein RCG17_15530 [Neobacillus sp. PS3-12]|uniref:hypothetical protein n=1 Tax=Neobacillus sp. PS3-12 TaxID=3070677 RepID=UPI0027E08FFE|nr:hypothetical protein [Neobacillus sp. PS3-12]WML50922.1 hypothetical protein RCG17_15530 [Neobacillus sp. PS3-12]